MRTFQCLLFALKRWYIYHYIICMTIPLMSLLLLAAEITNVIATSSFWDTYIWSLVEHQCTEKTIPWFTRLVIVEHPCKEKLILLFTCLVLGDLKNIFFKNICNLTVARNTFLPEAFCHLWHFADMQKLLQNLLIIFSERFCCRSLNSLSVINCMKFNFFQS